MKLWGRYVSGLDEFMLRAGHLGVVAEILSKGAFSPEALHRRLGEALTRSTIVQSPDTQLIAKYLKEKRLAPLDSTATEKVRDFRYPKILIAGDKLVSQSTGQVTPPLPSIWWQDYAFATSTGDSKVGAITFRTSDSSSKSGGSHIVDWARAIGIVNLRFGLSTEGKALSVLLARQGKIIGGIHENSPYSVGVERMLLLWILMRRDADIIARLTARLDAVEAFDKQLAIDAMLDCASDIIETYAKSRGNTSRAVAEMVRELREDLQLSGSRSPSRSTIWHRVSSRLELLVDAGVVEKVDRKGALRPYEYVYRSTPMASRLIKSLASNEDSDLDNALEKSLAGIGCGPNGSTATAEQSMGYIAQAVSDLSASTSVSLSSVAIVASCLALEDMVRLDLISVRELVEKFAVCHPEFARLSRGYAGPRAEFVSLHGDWSNAMSVFRS